jgi:uncharacterized cupredoxin-like copper-binding protein
VLRHSRRGLLLAAVLVLAACGQSRGAAPNVTRVDVVGTEMRFAPAVITTKIGQPVTVAFKNEGAVEHDWAVLQMPVKNVHADVDDDGTHGHHAADGSDPTVHVAAMPGNVTEVTFVPEREGRYTIVCTVPGHKDAGMMGMLTVTGYDGV